MNTNMVTKRNNNRVDRGANKKAGNVAPIKREVLPNIKPRTKAFVDKLLSDPTISNTQAYIDTHETNNRKVASIQSSRLLAKPSVQGYKDSALRKAKNRIVSLVDSENENTALKASQDIIDRNEGKAIQKNETVNRTVEVKLDLTGVKIGSHYLTPPQAQAIADGIAES